MRESKDKVNPTSVNWISPVSVLTPSALMNRCPTGETGASFLKMSTYLSPGCEKPKKYLGKGGKVIGSATAPCQSVKPADE